MKQMIQSKCPALAAAMDSYGLVVSTIETNLVLPVALDAASFKQCLLNKLVSAKSDCQGQSCTASCRDALNNAADTMDGSCCSEAPVNARAQCVQVVTQQMVPKMKQMIQSKCPALAAAMDSYGLVVSTIETNLVLPVALDAASFKQCLLNKLVSAKSDCSGQSCTAACRDALNNVVETMDGSCCSEAPANARAQCVQVVTQQMVPKMKQMIQSKCPALSDKISLAVTEGGLGAFGIAGLGVVAGSMIASWLFAARLQRSQILQSALLG